MEKETVLEIEFKQVWDKWAWNVTYDELSRDEEVTYGYCTVYKNKLDNIYLGFYDENIEDYECITNDVLLSNEQKSLVEKFMKYLNEEYDGKESKRKLFGVYYYITDTLEIDESRDLFNETDEKRYKVSNYFISHEEAEINLERVKKAYQEVWE